MEELSNKIYPKVYLRKGREKSVLNLHPWIFSGGIQKQDNCFDGDIVAVCSANNEILGYGHYTEKASIACRLFHFGNIEGNLFTKEYWFQKFTKAREARKKLKNTETNAWRWIFAEGDNLPGLILDVYHDTAVIQARTTGMKKLLPTLTEWIQNQNIQHIIQKEERGNSSQVAENQWILGKKQLTLIKENGFSFEVNVESGQKTGFYLDQRDNRTLFQRYAQERTSLNLCCYTGAFSVYAIAGGAKSITSVDVSKTAIEQAKKNIEIYYDQFQDTPIPCEFHVADCFDFLKQMPENHYDFIVLDPPAFSKNHTAIAEASRGYKEINLKAMRKIQPGGILFTFSCSQHIDKELFQKIIFAAAVDSKRNVRILHQLHQAPDHPINVFYPEGEYLKGFVLEVL